MTARCEVRAFGPLDTRVDGERIDLSAGLASAIVARLALAAGTPVPAERLVEAVWDEPPANAVGSLRVYVSRLRSGPLGAALHGGRGGYALDVAPDDVDVVRFRRLVDEAAADASTDPARWTEALSLWTAPPFEDLAAFPFALRERQELRARLHTLWEHLAPLLVERGEARTVVARLEQTLAHDPTHEGLVAHLARAYASMGRTSEALAVIDRLADLLAESAGLDPSPAIRTLRQAILRQDASVTGASGEVSIRRHHVPVPLTGLVGRQVELRRIEDARASHRLVSLVGPGGAGKTRLAVESARRATTSIDAEQWMVDLAAVPVDGDVLAATADALGAAQHSIESIAARVDGRPSLVILDNAEHVIAAARSLVLDLLTSCAGLAILVTSREPLGIAGEYVIRIGGLVGDAASQAVALFQERATSARGGIPLASADGAAIRRACLLLDGLPLALELAAARTDVLSIDELVSALDRGERLPGAGADSRRHASVENTIRWSTDSLPADESALLVELGGFAGPFTLDAVESICTVVDRPLRDVALSLARKSLVAVDETEDGHRRYRLLESMKAYVRSSQHPFGDEAWRVRHRTYFARLVDELAPSVHTHAAVATHTLLDSLAPDLQLATERSIEAGDRDMALRLAAGQSWHWFKRGWLADGRAVLDRALALPGPSDPAIEARALVGGVNLVYQSGDAEAAFEYVRIGIERATEGGDDLSLARLLAYAAYGRSLFGQPDEAERLTAQAMALAEGAPDWLRAELRMSEGQTLRALGKRSAALDSLAEAQRLARRAGNAWALTSSDYVAGKILLEVRRPIDAIALLAPGARGAASGGDYPSALALLHLVGGATALVERHAIGARIFGAVDAIGRRYSYSPIDAEGADAIVHRKRVSSGMLPREYDAAYDEGAALTLGDLLALVDALAVGLRRPAPRTREGASRA